MLIDENCIRRTRFNNAMERKYNNKKVALVDLKDNSYVIEIRNFDKENADKPCLSHNVTKGVVRVSPIRLTKETIEAIILNYLEIN